MKGRTTMRIKKIISSVLAAALCALSFSGCSSTGNTSSSSNETPTSNSSSETNPSNDSSNGESEIPNPEDDAEIKIVALKGPTAMGLTKLMEDSKNDDLGYTFEIKAAPEEISLMAANGSADIFCVPANLASILYKKTGGGVQAIAINTLGVLYICENGSDVNSVDDLKGKTIYSAGKGSTPEYALNFILTSNGLEPGVDVNIEWKNEHTECLQAMLSGENCVAMLPEPFVTTAKAKSETVNVVLDLNKEWDKLGVDSSLITGAAIVRAEFAQQHPDAVNKFLSEYEKSVDYVNNNIEEAAALIEKFDIVKAEVAKKAIPNCNIVCIYGSAMKDKLAGYLQVLFDNEPTAVGGAVPDDSFYYPSGN